MKYYHCARKILRFDSKVLSSMCVKTINCAKFLTKHNCILFSYPFLWFIHFRSRTNSKQSALKWRYVSGKKGVCRTNKIARTWVFCKLVGYNLWLKQTFHFSQLQTCVFTWNKFFNRRISKFHHGICYTPVAKLGKTFIKTLTFSNIRGFGLCLMILFKKYLPIIFWYT